MRRDKLGEYRDKRDWEATPEPRGSGSRAAREPRFVIHEHHARSLHWDLRLERDGVLVSWAIPKGIPTDPKRNRLAIHVEDHPLDYIDFAGEIPEGSYGAGTVEIWDQGTYEPHKFRDDEVIVTLRGNRVNAKFALFQTKANNWMIHRMDPPAVEEEPMPTKIAPMLATLGSLPGDDRGWGFEIKWDGIRAILYSEGGRARFTNRNLRDITAQYPELRGVGRDLGSRSAILDGEVVALDEDGKPSFGLLQRRMHIGSESAARRLSQSIPVVYMAFDLLYLDGRSTTGLSYERRRELLEALELSSSSAARVPAHHVGDGKAMLEASRTEGLEGIVAKRLDSLYEPGRRSAAWHKVKNRLRQEFVVGGWLPGQGGRSGRIGSLAVGLYDLSAAEAKRRGRPQRLTYVGNVGTGFKREDLVRLGELLVPLRRPASPFEGRQPPKGTIFVEARLVAEVEFRGWTHRRTLRAPSFKGLRDDKPAQDVVPEEVERKVGA